MSLSGLAKDILLVVTSTIIFKNSLSFLQIIGYMISLFGLKTYKEYKNDPLKFYVFFQSIFDYLSQFTNNKVRKDSNDILQNESLLLSNIDETDEIL